MLKYSEPNEGATQDAMQVKETEFFNGSSRFKLLYIVQYEMYTEHLSSSSPEIPFYS